MSKKKQIDEIFKDLCDAPIGGVKENLAIGTLAEGFTDEFIHTMAKHLYAKGYRKPGETVTCRNCIHRHPFGYKCVLDGVVHDDDYFCRDAKGKTKEE